ncbi:MAG: hypothetical protein P8184_03715 [Calditrichia bacterium]
MKLYSLPQLLDYHFQLRPLMQVQDVYKLLLQGVFDAEPLLSDPEQAKEMLMHEMKHQMPSDTKSLAESVSFDDKFIRVNLGPFREKGMDSEKLAEAFVQSAKPGAALAEDFPAIWREFMEVHRSGYPIRQAENEIIEFSDRVRKQDYAPVHHSDIYRKYYKSSYRIVNRKNFREAFHLTN